MKLSQAIYYKSYTGAVTCIRSPIKAFAHVCKNQENSKYGIREWWTVDLCPVRRNPIEPDVWSYNVAASEADSFKTIDGCYAWLKEHKISPYQCWYPTMREQQWWQLGEHQL